MSASAQIDVGRSATIHGSVAEAGGLSRAATERTLAALVSLIASHLGAEIARGHAEDARARMASLVDAGLALGQELSLDALLTRIVQSAREVLGARYATLGVLNATRTELAEFVTAGLRPGEEGAAGRLVLGHGLLEVPIALRGEVLGTLHLSDRAAGPFTADDERMALTFASQAAVAVDNVRRYEASSGRPGGS